MKVLVHSDCKNKNRGHVSKKTLICDGCKKKPNGDKVVLVKYKDELKIKEKKYNHRQIMRHEINNPYLFKERKGYGYPRV